jgi:tRNA U34 2-thiouridine synthase MnmA/TrmU
VSRLHAGRWRLQIDQRKRYSIKTKPRFVVKFSLMRSPRPSG